MKEIRIGLIGGGWMGKAHTTAFHNAKMIFGDDMPVFEIVSDVTEDAAKAFAEQMGYARYTADWHDVVSDPDVDLVDVATPNCMHYEMAKAALEHGKHVFCEKPLSLSAQQSSELAQLAKQLQDMGENVAYEQVMQAVSDFEKGNMRLSTVLAAMNG